MQRIAATESTVYPEIGILGRGFASQDVPNISRPASPLVPHNSASEHALYDPFGGER